MIHIRPARTDDAAAIGEVHVGAWRSAYAGLLPETYLAGLSASRQASYYQGRLLFGNPALVAETAGQVVGFVTMSCTTGSLADGEIETLYVLDDWRDQGAGRLLMQAAARRLADKGCRNAYLWVLRDNPSRWFYERLGGRHVADSQTVVAQIVIPKTAYVWDPISLLMATPAKS